MNPIRSLKQDEVDYIVNLHLSSLKEGLLYRMGKDILKIFYTRLLEDKDSFILVYELGGKITGVAAASKYPEKIFRSIKRKNFFKVALSIFRESVKSPSLLSSVLRSLLSKYSTTNNPELIFLFVDPQYRGKKIGDNLVKETSKLFRKINASQYKITIMSTNTRGKQFYERVGFKKSGHYMFLGELRDIYMYKL